MLEHYGGDGFHSRETGKFTVASEGSLREFTSMSEARRYYDSLEGEKAFWDNTGCPELLDAWHVEE